MFNVSLQPVRLINLVEGDHTTKLEDCGTMGAGLNPGARNAALID